MLTDERKVYVPPPIPNELYYIFENLFSNNSRTIYYPIAIGAHNRLFCAQCKASIFRYVKISVSQHHANRGRLYDLYQCIKCKESIHIYLDRVIYPVELFFKYD